MCPPRFRIGNPSSGEMNEELSSANLNNPRIVTWAADPLGFVV